MVRKITPSQLRSLIRQAEQERRQAVNRYNAAVRQHNQLVQRAVDDYNRDVRAHNSRVRAHRRRLQAEMARLELQRSNTRYVTTQTSTHHLHDAFARLSTFTDAGGWTEHEAALAELAEAEAANSARVVNALLGDAVHEEAIDNLGATTLTNELTAISPDLDKRWRGALYALSPNNPDAARHFCTSAREILTRMIDAEAPDDVVLAARPGCATTDRGQPQRRVKISYLLERTGVDLGNLGHFVERDIDDVLQLFRVFNDGTHGSTGTYSVRQLVALKSRVEGAITFLSALMRG